MIGIAFRLLVIAGAGLALALPLQAQDIGQFRFSVRNNTAQRLACDFRQGNEAWRTIELSPGSEWRELAEDAETIAQVKCRAPVRQVVYSVRPGARYVFLRRTGQATIKLRAVQVQ